MLKNGGSESSMLKLLQKTNTCSRKIQHDEKIQSMIWKYMLKFATACGNENKHVEKRDSASSMFNCMWQKKKAC
jgi:hypothetical protein